MPMLWPSSNPRTGGADEALSRLLAFLGVTAGYKLGLQRAFALAFGDAVAYLITGNPAGLGTDFERGMAHRIFWGEGHSQQLHGSPLDERVWQQAGLVSGGCMTSFAIGRKTPRAMRLPGTSGTGL